MAEPIPDPWLVFEVPGGFPIAAQCVSAETIKGQPKVDADLWFDGPAGRVRIMVDVVHTDSTWMVWRVRIRWPGMFKLDNLDVGGKCLGCGKTIVDANVTHAGRVLVGHEE